MLASDTVASGVLVAHANVDIGNPIQASTLTTTGAYSPAPLTTTSADTLLALFFSSGNGKSIWETPTGWSAAFPGGQNATSCGSFFTLQAQPGTTAPVTAVEYNIPYADVGYAHLIALNPCSECGDGDVKGAEECDDGNTLDGDGCSSTCTLEVPDYTITHTGNNGDGLRWNLGNGGFLVEDVPSWMRALWNAPPLVDSIA